MLWNLGIRPCATAATPPPPTFRSFYPIMKFTVMAFSTLIASNQNASHTILAFEMKLSPTTERKHSNVRDCLLILMFQHPFPNIFKMHMPGIASSNKKMLNFVQRLFMINMNVFHIVYDIGCWLFCLFFMLPMSLFEHIFSAYVSSICVWKSAPQSYHSVEMWNSFS